MIEGLFPPGVVVVVATADMWEAAPLPEEEPLIARARAKRRREFAAGRSCARAALEGLGHPPRPLLADPDRVPIWPDGVVGSITHTDRACAAAVAPAARFRGLGLDLEEAGPLPPDVAPMVCLPGELDGLPAGGPAWDKVVFSAKEAFYKCVFPAARVMLEFDQVRVRLDPGGRTFLAGTVDPLPGAPASLAGRFAWTDDLVAAAVSWPA